MSLLFNMLSRLVSKHLLISWLQSPSPVILEPPKINSDTVSTVITDISTQQIELLFLGDSLTLFLILSLSGNTGNSMSSFSLRINFQFVILKLFSEINLKIVSVHLRG